MFKVPFLFIFIALMGFKAHAVELKLTHDQFVHLTDSQKNEWIIKTMELMVELESRYQHEIKTSGWSQERFDRYTQIMKKFQSLLMDSAYAAPVVSWETHGRNFSSLLKNANGGRNCIYAGWVSRVVNQGGKEYCVHPNTYPNSPEGKAYAKGSACEGKNKITCNPAVFGYKSEGSGSLFCVNAGLNEAHNSSYSCMKEALADAAAQGADSKEVRLRNLRNRLSQNPEIFQDVQKFIFQTCVCEATPMNLNTRYHEYMRPHRTCYGMMEMLSATACEEPKIDFDTSFFVKLRDFTNGKIIRSSSGTEVDATYTNYLNDIRKNAGDEYARLCPQDGITVKTPAVEVKPESGTTTPPVLGSVPDAQVQTNVPTLETVNVKPDEEVPTYQCRKAVCRPGTPTPKPETTEPKAAAAPSEGDRAPGSQGPRPEVKPEAAKPAETFTCKFEVVEKLEGVEDKLVTLKSEPVEVPKSREDKTLMINAVLESKTEQLSCDLTFEGPEVAEEKSGTKPTVTVTLKEKTNAFQVVKAELKDDEGYTLKWFRKGYPDSDKEEPKKDAPKSGPTFAGSQEDEAPEEKEVPSTEEIKNEVDDSENTLEIDEPLKAKTYETCAILIAPGRESSDESCVTIPLLKNRKQIVAPANPQQPQMPPRGTTNTSALGIR